MFEPSFSFDGVKKDFVVTEEGRKRQVYKVNRNLLYIPGMAGALLESTDKDVRVISQPVSIMAKSKMDLRKLEEELVAWLVTEDPRELIFDDEPDRLYYAVVDGSFDTEELVNVGQGTITFLCLDPHKYGFEKGVSFVDTGVFNVEGTIETHPNIKVEIKQDATFVAVSDGDKMNLIGRPIEATQQPFEREERKFWHQMNTLVGWADTTSVEEGKILGTMKTQGHSFYTDTYGTDAGWHGPAKKISIGSVVQDFQVDALVRQLSRSGQVGSIEIALLDASNKFVAKILMTKRAANSAANYATLRAGTTTNGRDIISTRGAYENTWANFNGMLRISRVGNVWSAYVCLIDANGVQHTRDGGTWVDSNHIATAPIAQVQVQLWQYGTVPATDQHVDDIKVFKINSPGDNQIPYVARAGDIIEFDHQADIIRKNGEDITREKAFIGEYFSLKKSMNKIIVEPAAAIQSTEVRWKPKWL